MASVIQLTWPEITRVKDALITIEKIKDDCEFADLELTTGLKVTMDLQGIRIEGSTKYYEHDMPVKPSSEGGD